MILTMMMIVMIVLVMRTIVVAVTVAMIMMSVVVMLVIVPVMIFGRDRGTDGMQRPTQALRLPDKALALDPDQPRRGKRQHDTAPPGFLVGNEVGRDHRLAMAGPRRMEDAVDKRDAEQSPD